MAHGKHAGEELTRLWADRRIPAAIRSVMRREWARSGRVLTVCEAERMAYGVGEAKAQAASVWSAERAAKRAQAAKEFGWLRDK